MSGLIRELRGEPLHHLGEFFERVEARLRGDVRRNDDVVEPEQLVVAPAGRLVERIERKAAEPSDFSASISAARSTMSAREMLTMQAPGLIWARRRDR